jgi:hypothetical protein
MKRAFFSFVLLSAFFVGGCGGGTSTSPITPQQANIQTGQWEFTIASTNGNPNIFVETDLTEPQGMESAIGSYIYATALFWPQTGGGVAGLYDYCVNEQTSLSVVGNAVTAMIFEGSNQVAQATATLSADGKSMNGTYQLNTTIAANGVICGGSLLSLTGTFSGQVVAPLNGTYKGTLSDGSALTVQITQNSSFDITATGTSVLPGVTTNFTLGPNPGSPTYNNIIGATVSAPGTATNVNGTQSFQVFGHFNPNASQVSFVSNNGQWSTGTLAKQ